MRVIECQFCGRNIQLVSRVVRETFIYRLRVPLCIPKLLRVCLLDRSEGVSKVRPCQLRYTLLASATLGM